MKCLHAIVRGGLHVISISSNEVAYRSLLN